MSARWLQHYAQGIEYLVENNKVPSRSFIFYNSTRPAVDIRHLVGFCIGSDSFLSIFGGGRPGSWEGGHVPRGCRRESPIPTADLQKLCRAKTASFQNFMPRVQSTHGCVIQ